MAIVYKVTNLINNKIYIGQSVYNNSKYYGSGKYLKFAIKKYGKENFIKEVVEECDSSNLNEREKYWINYYDSIKNGYNISKGGQKGWMVGLKHSDESKKQMSYNHIKEKNHMYGKHHTEETKNKISNSLKKSEIFKIAINKEDRIIKIKKNSKNNSKNVPFFLGKKHSEESKRKMSEAKKGKTYALGLKHSEESKRKMSELKKGKAYFLGKTHTDEWKEFMRKIHTGKNVSDETRQKLRNININKKLTSETKEKISNSLKKEIYQVIDNIVMYKFCSAEDAGKFLNISIKKIGYYCRKKNLKNKYNIIYKNDYEAR